MSQSGPTEVHPHLPHTVLPNANWADAFEIETDRGFADMKAVANCMVGTMPNWSKHLLRLRNILVAPFGLKPGDPRGNQPDAEHIDFFPVLEQEDARIVLGLDDQHLDFRIVLERHSSEAGARYRLTTLVEQHNPFGRIYIFLIAPFHKRIVQSVMKNAL
ncbi:MAG: DUF2867 domain-containing protein [Paracoccaceae bacterium]